MHRKGHVGMALLAFAPIAYVLISEGKPIFAALCFLGVQTVEPWPDQDFHLPFLTHRGVSHSLLAILVVGGVLGAVGWFLGGHLFDLLLAALLAGGDLFGWILGLLPETTAEMITILLPDIALEAVVDRAHRIAGESVNQWTFAAYGLFVGAYGIFSHLLGDVITVSGIKPFLPLSRWRLSLSSLRADSPTANSGLFFIGVLAVGVVIAMTAPAILGLGVPADLSPIGTVSAQSANQSGTAVVFDNQTAANSTVTIQRVTLSDNGFVGIHIASKNGSLGSASLLGVSKHLSIGSHRNVTITVSKLNSTQKLVAVPYHDLNDDNKFNRKKVFGSGNATFTKKGGRTVHDTARVRASTKNSSSKRTGNSSSKRTGGQNQTTNATASVVFANQTTNGTSVTISSVTVPKGGFVVIHGPAYSQQGIVSGSAITVSRYLSPGTHRNITIQFDNGIPGAVSNMSEFSGVYAPLSAVVYADTNGNKHYDYVASVGQNDTAYHRNGSRVADQAHIVTQEQLDRKTQPTAALAFTYQNATNGTLTVERVRLPRGGWVVIHNQTYITENDPITSAIGHSKYLSAGVHRNVTITLNWTPNRSQTAVAVAYRETNSNSQFDYIRTGGMADYGYVNRTGENATLVTDIAYVSVPSSASNNTSATGISPPGTAGSQSSTTPTGGSANGSTNANGGVLAGLPLWLKALLAIVAIVLGLTLIGRIT